MRGRDERGLAVSVWVTLALPAFIVVVGLGVDLSGHAAAEQEVRATAAQAARAATHRVFVEADGLRMDEGAARRAARSYAAAAGFDADVAVSPTGAMVTLRGSYETLFLPLIGVQSLPVVGTATAALELD